ncbi:MAG: hypothetical protein HY748_14490 [Elusimicrobia bacterium]|nr:hypothetical protein [Elusimicrobiota bacterium]
MRFRAAASVAFAFLFPVSQAAFSQQVAKVRVQTPVTGSAGVLAGASYNAAASVHAQPLVGGALHGLPTQIGAIPTLSHPVLQAVPAANAFP